MSELPLCACGCGRHVRKQGNRFVNGHNRPRLGQHINEETRQKLRNARIGSHLTDSTKEKMRISSKLRKPECKLTYCKYGCGEIYSLKSYLDHLRKFHPDKFLEHQRSASSQNHDTISRRRNGNHLANKLVVCKYKCGHKYHTRNLLNHLRKYHYEIFIKNQKKAAKGSGRINGPKLKIWTEQNPEHQSEAGRQAHIKRPEVFVESGRNLGRMMVESGQIWELLNKMPSMVYHQSLHLSHLHDSKSDLESCKSCKTHPYHYHRSKAERKKCIELHSQYPQGWVHPNVIVRIEDLCSIEVDFVISPSDIFNSKDPSTWQKIIEYHPPRTWKDETMEFYTNKRTTKLKLLGIECPIEVHTK